MATPHPHLPRPPYGGIKPGDRVVNGFLDPTRPDAHLLARTVAEILGTYRTSGFDDHGISRRDRFTYYDHDVITWRDSNGSVFDSRADEDVYIVPAR